MERKYSSVHIAGQQTPTLIEETLRRMLVGQRSLGDFRSLLGHDDRRVRFYAARVVAIFSGIPLEVVQAVYGHPDGLAETIDLTDVPSVIRHLEKQSPPAYRKALVNVLDFHGTSHAGLVAPVLGALIGRGCDPDIRAAAFLALQGMGRNASSAKEAVSALTELIVTVEDPAVRVKAIEAIREQGPDAGSDAVPTLIHALDDSSVDVRLAACSVLGSLGVEARESTPSLCRLLKTEGPVRQKAVRALLQIDPEGRILPGYLDDFSRPVLIDELKRIGEPARGLRHQLQGLGESVRYGIHHAVVKEADECFAPDEHSHPDVKLFRTKMEIAKYAGVSPRTVYNWMMEGKIPKEKEEEFFRIPMEVLAALSQPSKPGD
jgi:hypothetical protein